MKLLKQHIVTKEQDSFERKVDLADRVARRTISLGGYGIILVIVFILLFLVYQSIPLLKGAKLKQHLFKSTYKKNETILLTGLDEYQEIAYTLNENGVVIFYRLDSKKDSPLQIIRMDSLQLLQDEKIIFASKGNLQSQAFSTITNKGRLFYANDLF